MNQKEKSGGFLHGALVLSVGMIFVKLVGVLFKIPLHRTVGEYGMGLFHTAYQFYAPALSVTTIGLPAAVSRLVAENRSRGQWQEAKAVRRVAFPLFLSAGAVAMLLLCALAPVYCRFSAGEEERFSVLIPLLALAPAVLFSAVSAVCRGYFEGIQNMKPTAASQGIEALGKLLLGLTFSHWIVEHCTKEYAAFGTVLKHTPQNADQALLMTLSFAAAGALLGVVLGSFAAMLFLLLRLSLSERGKRERSVSASQNVRSLRALRRRLLAIAVPIALGSISTNITGVLDAALLQNRLSALVSTAPEVLLAALPGAVPQVYLAQPETLPTFLYGCYTLALTVSLLVPALAQPISMSALPMVTEAFEAGKRSQLIERCISVCRVTVLLCAPAGIGISALSLPIVQLLYGSGTTAPVTGDVLQVLGVASVFSSLSVVLTGMLQALGRADLPVKLQLFGMAVKLTSGWLLCSMPKLNLFGAAVSTLLCDAFLATAQFFCVNRACDGTLSICKIAAKPVASALLCGMSAAVVYHWLSDSGISLVLSLFGGILSGVLVYTVSLVLLRTFSKNDLQMMPKGQKIQKMLEKWDRM